MGWGTGELKFRSCKKPSIYGDDNLSHGMSVLPQYFHLVSTKCKMNKLLDIFVYLKHNKTNLKTPFKSQYGNKYYLKLNLNLNLNLNLSISFWPHIRFPVNSSFKICLPHTFDVFLIFNILMYICNLLFLFLIYIKNFWHMNYGFYFSFTI